MAWLQSRTEAAPAECPIKGPRWRRWAALGTLLFLIKGLLWLIVPALLVLWNSLKN